MFEDLDGCSESNFFAGDSFDGGLYSYPYGSPYCANKVYRATKGNVEEAIAVQLNSYVYELSFIQLDSLPTEWKHSCLDSGVTKLNANSFVFDDGAVITFAVCPFFPKCNTVLYYIDKVNM